MAKFEVALTDGRNDWLTTIEASSNREAVSKALAEQLLRRRRTDVDVLSCNKIEGAPAKEPVKVPEHIAAYMGRERV